MILYLSIFNSFRVTRCLSQCVSPKISIFSTFLFPWGRPCGNHAKRCMNEKTIQCLPNSRSMYPSIFNSFPVIRTGIAKKSPFSRTAAHIFVSPGDAPAIITQYVAWMERQFSACRTACSMYPSICNSFRVIRTAIAKNRRFRVPQPTFLFPLETPLRLSRNMLHGWKDNSILAKPFAACTYLSSIYSFRVIRCLSQCVSPKIAIFTTFLFPLGTPLGQSR